MDLLHLCMQIIWRAPYLKCSKISPAFHCFLFWIWEKLMSVIIFFRLMTNGKISFEKKTILYRLLPDDAIVVASGGHGLHFCACTNHFITVLKLLRLTLCPCDLSYLPCKELAAFAWQSIQECSPWKLFRLIRMKAHTLPLWFALSSRRQPRDPPSWLCPHPSPDKPNPSRHCLRNTSMRHSLYIPHTQSHSL